MGKAARQATTFRIDPLIKGGLEKLSKILGKPLNKLANEALGEYVAKRTLEVEDGLESTLKDLRAYRKSDPNFDRAIALSVKAEAAMKDDPAEGRIVTKKGPAETAVRELLSE